MTEFNVDREAFRAWLAAMPGRAVCGLRGRAADCPIACYLSATIPGCSPMVSQWAIGVNGDVCPGDTPPAWVADFVMMLDGPDDDIDDSGREVSAGEALEVLDNV